MFNIISGAVKRDVSKVSLKSSRHARTLPCTWIIMGTCSVLVKEEFRALFEESLSKDIGEQKNRKQVLYLVETLNVMLMWTPRRNFPNQKLNPGIH